MPGFKFAWSKTEADAIANLVLNDRVIVAPSDGSAWALYYYDGNALVLIPASLGGGSIAWADVSKSGSSLADLATKIYDDLTSKPTLGDSASKNVGTSAGTVSAGDHVHSGVYEPADAAIQTHLANVANPHTTTLTQVSQLNSTPLTDDSYQGITTTGVAGEEFAQWDLLYSKNVSGSLQWFKYDANGADKNIPPSAMATEAAGIVGAAFRMLLFGFVRNDGWAMTSNQDEGKIVYGSGTAGGIVLGTSSFTSGDIVSPVGQVFEENVILFRPSLIFIGVAA